MPGDPRHDGSADPVDQGRRELLGAAALLPALAAFSGVPRAGAAGGDDSRPARFVFTSQGKTAQVNADGSGLRYFDSDRPGGRPGRSERRSPTGAASRS